MDLVNDDIKVVLKEDKVIITRTTTDEYDAEEYLRLIAKNEYEKERLKASVEQISELIKQFKEKESEVQKIRNKQREEQKNEVAKVIAKENQA